MSLSLSRLSMALVFLLVAGSAEAQTDAEINSGIQFNFTTPGARSLGLGGAFLALADDATAAFTNPAGLVDLSQRQVSAEVRRFTYRHSFTDRGHAFGFATGVGADTAEGVVQGESENDVVSFSFFSYVHPWERFSVAVYRHELVSFEASFRAAGAFFDHIPAPRERATDRLAPVDAHLRLEIANLGLSAAYRIRADLSLGVGLSRYDFEIDSLQERFSTRGLDPTSGAVLPEDAPGALFGEAEFSPDNVLNFQRQFGTDEGYGVNLGFLWKIGAGASLGGAYRRGPEFEYEVTNRSGAFAEAVFGVPRGTLLARQRATFRVPDVIGLGVAVKRDLGGRGGSSRRMSLSLDYNRVRYSALTDNLVSVFRTRLDPNQAAALAALRVDDGDELRGGLELSWSRARRAFFARFGAWYDPDHKIRFAAEPGLDPETRSQAAQFLGPGEDDVHLTAGFGVQIGDLKLDAAVDLADAVETGSISLVYFF